MRMSSCRSSVTSWRKRRRDLPLSPPLLRSCRQLVARTPQRREEVVVDHLPEHLDGRPLRPDDLVADDPRDDLVVADAPHRDALVPLDQRLGELVELLVVASLHVHLDEVEARRRRRPARTPRRAAASRGEPRGSRASRSRCRGRARGGSLWYSHGRHLLEHVELARDELQAERSAPQQAAAPRRARPPRRAPLPARPPSSRASARAPTTGAPSGTAARRDGTAPRASSAAPGGRPCAGSARSPTRPARAGSARRSPRESRSPRALRSILPLQ